MMTHTTQTLTTQDGQTISAPPQCQIHRVSDRFGAWKFFATPIPAESGIPLWYDGRHWLLCSPLIANLFAAACANQDKPQSNNL